MKTDPVSARHGAMLTPEMRRRVLFWLGALLALILLLYLFRAILLPFIAGMALAYLLDPVADRLERWGASRFWATVIILLMFIIVLTLSLLLLVPVLSNQLAGLIARLPGYVTSLQALITDAENPLLRRLLGESQIGIRENLDELLKQGAGWLTTLLASIWSSGKAILDVVSLFVITPIVAFYLLLDWDRMIARVDGWLPRDNKTTIREIAADIDAAIAGFVRGQGSVCLILGTFYAIGLTAVGLNFGLLIGMFAGLISFIPFVGSLVGLVLSVGVALVQFWPDFWWVLLVAGIFGFGQFVEGNILQPKLVGSSVGLHPVWLMFALSAFGVMMGFTGLLIAVPVAAAIGVLVRFALDRYLQSRLFLGDDDPHTPAA